MSVVKYLPDSAEGTRDRTVARIGQRRFKVPRWGKRSAKFESATKTQQRRSGWLVIDPASARRLGAPMWEPDARRAID